MRWIDNLARHLLGLEDRAVLALAPRHAGALLHLFPVLGPVPGARRWPAAQPQFSPADLRRRGFDALRELIAKLSDEQPILLWIDDVQWSDRDSGPALRVLLSPRQMSSAPAAPLLTSRDDPVSTRLIGEFDGLVPTVDIALGPLSGSETRELARDLAGGSRAGVISTRLPTNRWVALSARRADPPRPQFPGSRLATAALQRCRCGQVEARPFGEARRLLEIVARGRAGLRNGSCAAGRRIGPAGHVLRYSMCAEYLLRVSTRRTSAAILETYHDRIREFVIAELGSEARRARHRDLAESIRASRNPNARALVKHYVGAEDHAQASHFAMLAAEEADVISPSIRRSRCTTWRWSFDRAAGRIGSSCRAGLSRW